ncbi:MAG TPA: NAD(P)/FAD-dependent oxidoreductase [Actinomycetes bacterium]|nr:NAD(P)/FAD-dependent oxidoreductase [Actinomycetes bacterium]
MSAAPATRPPIPRILVVGGGYVGMYTSLRLLKKLRNDEAIVTVVDPRSYMTYQPFLPEAAAGAVSPRHVVVPLRRVLRGAEIVNARVLEVKHAERRAIVQPLEGDPYPLEYDHIVIAVGSVSRTLPIPGLAEWATGFKTVEEAIQLRNRVLECLDIAESTHSPEIRERNLNFVVVGGGFAGVEALAELEDMARYATRYYRYIEPSDLHFYLVEAADAILPEVGPEMGVKTLEQLRKRGIDVKLETRLESCVGGHVVLSDGTTFDAETVVWTAGVKASPVLQNTDLPLNERGRLQADATLRVVGTENAWGAGDGVAVPDLTTEDHRECAPNAQHAVRQSKVLADNLIASLRGFPVHEYRHKYVGSVAGLGLFKGVANVYGIKLKGPIAWFMHRTYHVSRVPTLNRKIRVIVDWTMALFFKREIVSLWSMHEPFHEFQEAAKPSPPDSSQAPPAA